MKEELAVEITELEEIFTGPLVLIQSFGKDIFILPNKPKEKWPWTNQIKLKAYNLLSGLRK